MSFCILHICMCIKSRLLVSQWSHGHQVLNLTHLRTWTQSMIVRVLGSESQIVCVKSLIVWKKQKTQRVESVKPPSPSDTYGPAHDELSWARIHNIGEVFHACHIIILIFWVWSESVYSDINEEMDWLPATLARSIRRGNLTRRFHPALLIVCHLHKPPGDSSIRRAQGHSFFPSIQSRRINRRLFVIHSHYS